MSVEYSARTLRRRLIWTAGALAFLALAVPAIRHLREAAPGRPAPLRGHWSGPEGVTLGSGADFPFGLAIAPDGRRVVFPAARDGNVQLWLHDLVSGQASAIAGTNAAAFPFWSPDGTRVGFFATGSLKSLDLQSGMAVELLPAELPGGASWSPRGDVVAATGENGLTLRSSDGQTREFTALDAAAGETAHLFPTFVTGGTHVLFFVRASQPARQGIWIAPVADGAARRRLVGGAASGLSIDGQLIFANDGALMTQGLDADALALLGRPVLLGAAVGHGPLGQLLAAASSDVLIYSPPLSWLRELVWVTRAGERIGTVGSPADSWQARIAPDGTRVAAAVLDPLLRTLDVVLFDGLRLMPARLSSSIDMDETPAWSPDGRRLAWVTAGHAVTVRSADAVQPAETLARFTESVKVSDWTSDGRNLIVTRTMVATREDVWLVPAIAGGTARPLVATPFADVQGTVSPDGRLVAYASDESGRFEVYVEPVEDRPAGVTARERITSGGGSDPRWSRSGRELFFRRGSQIHAATPASGRGQNAVAATSMLLDTKVSLRAFDVAADGSRLLLNIPAVSTGAGPATMLVHWPRAQTADRRR